MNVTHHCWFLTKTLTIDYRALIGKKGVVTLLAKIRVLRQQVQENQFYHRLKDVQIVTTSWVIFDYC